MLHILTCIQIGDGTNSHLYKDLYSATCRVTHLEMAQERERLTPLNYSKKVPFQSTAA